MRTSLLCSLILICSLSVFAQFPNILLDEQGSPSEPSIVINPKNPDNIVAGAILDKVYVTEDAGKSWKRGRISSSMGVWGDPCLIADPKGNIYYLHLSDPTGKNWRSEEILDRIVCQRSKDGGNSWTDGGHMGLAHPKDQDKEWAVADAKGRLYACWTEFDDYGSEKEEDKSRILFSTSTNKGKTWSKAVSISQFEGDCIDDDQTTEGAVPAIGPNGEVYVSWSYDNKIYFDRSLDRGQTWLEEDIVVSDQPGGWSINIPAVGRANGMPVTRCDLSKGAHKGTIYINWADQRNGEDDTDIWLAKSTDQGQTWSTPKRVNDDGPGSHQFFTWMDVDPKTGYIYIVFYDRRAYKNIRSTDVYLAYSEDAGETFKNVKISDSPFKPNRGAFFGDYNNISAYDGRICPIWTRMDAGKTSIWTSVIDHESLKKQ